MKILVIRHGESEADILHVHEGRADFALTAEGQRQAAAMAKWVAGLYTIDKIYASTLTRAQQTA
ncbi:MAG TPA: histidine phosphatase family protein, partial [Firmicutes bacterium]|nr:histidine phosphatase family protein [Bacillota bacterium]